MRALPPVKLPSAHRVWSRRSGAISCCRCAAKADVVQVVLGSYAVQFPLGGYLSWILQWLVGLSDLGHDVVFVEKSEYAGSCYDPLRGEMGDDSSYGVAALESLLARFGLGGRWCFVDHAGGYHGLSRDAIEQTFRRADVFIDMG